MADAQDESGHIALEVLASLSERSTEGRLRDAIAVVRAALWDELEDSEPAGQTQVSQDLKRALPPGDVEAPPPVDRLTRNAPGGGGADAEHSALSPEVAPREPGYDWERIHCDPAAAEGRPS